MKLKHCIRDMVDMANAGIRCAFYGPLYAVVRMWNRRESLPPFWLTHLALHGRRRAFEDLGELTRHMRYTYLKHM